MKQKVIFDYIFFLYSRFDSESPPKLVRTFLTPYFYTYIHICVFILVVMGLNNLSQVSIINP